MIYLASPYSHPDPDIQELRYQQVLKYTAVQLGHGEPIISPIVYGHQISVQHGAPTDHFSWLAFNQVLLDACNECRVLKIHGWEESLGVLHEIEYSLHRGIEVTYVEFPY